MKMARVKVSVTCGMVHPKALLSGMRNTLQAYTAPSPICITMPAIAIPQRFGTAWQLQAYDLDLSLFSPELAAR